MKAIPSIIPSIYRKRLEDAGIEIGNAWITMRDGKLYDIDLTAKSKTVTVITILHAGNKYTESTSWLPLIRWILEFNEATAAETSESVEVESVTVTDSIPMEVEELCL